MNNGLRPWAARHTTIKNRLQEATVHAFCQNNWDHLLILSGCQRFQKTFRDSEIQRFEIKLRTAVTPKYPGDSALLLLGDSDIRLCCRSAVAQYSWKAIKVKTALEFCKFGCLGMSCFANILNISSWIFRLLESPRKDP